MLIVGNWKMNGLSETAKNLVQGISKQLTASPSTNTHVLCPPATLLKQTAEQIEPIANLFAGAQDCHIQTSGAYTGNISAEMIADAGGTYVILGHSERREYHHESNEDVSQKAEAAIAANLQPIICVGESLEEYQNNQTIEVIKNQTLASLPRTLPDHIIIAYEPIWAIGSGKIPSLEEIDSVHQAIIECLQTKKMVDKSRISVLYGGSVKPNNAAEILALPTVGGALIGGASLKAEDFCAIAAAVPQ